jgi:hemerythrin-like domain-containing protein
MMSFSPSIRPYTGKMMTGFANRITQVLHEEHRATIALMERLEQLIMRFRKGAPPDVKDSAVATLLSDLSTGVTHEVRRHFNFEEAELFRYLADVGDQVICEHLTEEHTAMRPLGVVLAALAQEARAQGFDAARWEEFRRTGQELCDRMLAHVQKEEMALLPLLDENMDAEKETELLEKYTEAV